MHGHASPVEEASERSVPGVAIALVVCQGDFDGGSTGETPVPPSRMVVLSVPEGDDKPAKYPAIFQGSQALVISKMDLLPHIRFDVDRVVADMKRLAPEAAIFQVAALEGDGIAPLADWLMARSIAAVDGEERRPIPDSGR